MHSFIVLESMRCGQEFHDTNRQAWLYRGTRGLLGLGYHLNILCTNFSSPLQKDVIIGRMCVLDCVNNMLKFVRIVHT
jgi:hypothetical protein